MLVRVWPEKIVGKWSIENKEFNPYHLIPSFVDTTIFIEN